MDYGKKIDIFQYQKPDKEQFMVIELLGMPVGKTLHVIRLNETNALKLGRGHDADVRVADISVSRHHANLKYDKDTNSIIMQDHQSKFGTLKLIKKPKQIKYDEFVDTHI